MSEEVSIRIKGDARGGVEAFERLGGSANSARQRIEQANAAISASTAKLTGIVAGLGSALAATSFMRGVRDQLDFADAMDESAQKAGVATSAFSELAYAGKFAGLGTEELVKMLNKVTEASVKVASGDGNMRKLFVETLGVKVTTATGAMRNADEVLMDLIDKMSSIEDPTLRASVAMAAFGEKLGPQLLPLINLTKQGVVDLREEARRLGVTVTDEAGAAAGDLKDNLDRLKATQEGLYNQIMTQMLPGLNQLAAMWLENNRNAGLLKGTLQTLATAAGMGPMLGYFDIGTEIQNTTSQLEKAKVSVQSLKQSLDMAKGSFGVSAYLFEGKSAEALEGDLRAAEKRVQALQTSLASLQRRQALVSQGGSTGVKKSAGGDADASARARIAAEEEENRKKAEREKSAAARSAAAEARRLAAERTRALNEERQRQRDLYEDKVAQLRTELAQWRNNTAEQLRIADEIAASAKKTFGAESAEYSRAQQEIVRIKQRAADQIKQIDQEARQAQMEAALAAIALEQQQADQAVALGTMTQGQRLAQEMQFEERVTDIKRKALMERLQLLEKDPDMNPVERARIQQEIEELDRQHELRKGEIKGAQDRDKAGPAMNVIDSVEQNLASQTSQMIMGQQSAMETLKNLWSSTANTFVQELVTKPLAAWLAGQARMTVASLLGVQTRTAAEAAGAATTTAITGASVIKQIAMRAWAVAAGVYSALAAIPIVGPVIAPVAAVAATAAVLGFARNVFSAEGGFDIPAGVNPMVQAHAKEMILPARYADVIRGLAAGGGAAGGQPISINVSAIDPRGFERWLRGPGGAAIVSELALRQRGRG